jgi:DNA integrity scanning protein DisA with diadenylate cyclase activity
MSLQEIISLRDEIVRAGEVLAERIGANAIINISPEGAEIRRKLHTRIPVILARLAGESEEGGGTNVDIFTRIPADVDRESLFLKVSRIELMSEAVEAAYIKGRLEDGIVLGIVSIGDVNSLVVFDITDIPFIRKMADLASMVDYVLLKAVMNVAIEIGREGREGKHVGTAFIMGDTEKVLQMSHQIILNPYAGHSSTDRDIRNEDTWETVKEFAQLDGMFIIDDGGHIIAAGRYLDVSAKGVTLVPGLGGRHLAAAAITQCSKSVAITVSESSGTVTVYKGGKEIFQLNPRIAII